MKNTPDRDGSHDFDFQTGHWCIRNERLKKRLQGCTEWETFEATQEARPLPGGLGNIDDFVTDHWPGFVGMSLRLYNRRTRQWSIYWASNQIDGLEPPVVGAFENGVGVFEGRHELDGRPILVRFTWSNITQTGARWEQEFSPDGGETWEKNWIMTMTRVDQGDTLREVLMSRLFAVTRSRGPAWQAERPMEEQDEWRSHAVFMTALHGEGFILLGGPLDGTPDVLLIARASDEDEIRARLSDDSWTRNGLLRIKQIVPWTLRLGTLGRA